MVKLKAKSEKLKLYSLKSNNLINEKVKITKPSKLGKISILGSKSIKRHMAYG